jgi:hypothetical protein
MKSDARGRVAAIEVYPLEYEAFEIGLWCWMAGVNPNFSLLAKSDETYFASKTRVRTSFTNFVLSSDMFIYESIFPKSRVRSIEFCS